MNFARKIVELGRPLEMGMPVAASHPPFNFSLLRRHGDVVRDDGLTTANESIALSAHTGAHIDALGHASMDGAMFGGRTVDEVQPDGRGLRALGAETIPAVFRRGVLLDVAGHLGVDCLEPGQPVDDRLLDETAQACDVEVHAGDVVLVRTGWGRYWGDPDRFIGLERGLPGPDSRGAAWLADRDIFASGSDTLVYEVVQPHKNVRPVHRLFLVERGIYIMEALDLDSLAEERVYDFLFVALPLRIVGATASPIRPVAVLD